MELPPIKLPEPITVAAREEKQHEDAFVTRLLVEAAGGPQSPWPLTAAFAGYDGESIVSELDAKPVLMKLDDLRDDIQRFPEAAAAMGAVLQFLPKRLAAHLIEEKIKAKLIDLRKTQADQQTIIKAKAASEATKTNWTAAKASAESNPDHADSQQIILNANTALANINTRLSQFSNGIQDLENQTASIKSLIAGLLAEWRQAAATMGASNTAVPKMLENVSL